MNQQEASQHKLWNDFVHSLIEAEATWDSFRSQVQVDLLFKEEFPTDAMRILSSGMYRSRFGQVVDRLFGYVGHKPLSSLLSKLPEEEKDDSKSSTKSTGGSNSTRRR